MLSYLLVVPPGSDASQFDTPMHKTSTQEQNLVKKNSSNGERTQSVKNKTFFRRLEENERESPLSLSQCEESKTQLFDDFLKIQCEVLSFQKRHIELKNSKLQKDIERVELEAENVKLQNTKLLLEIDIMMKQNKVPDKDKDS